MPATSSPAIITGTATPCVDVFTFASSAGGSTATASTVAPAAVSAWRCFERSWIVASDGGAQLAKKQTSTGLPDMADSEYSCPSSPRSEKSGAGNGWYSQVPGSIGVRVGRVERVCPEPSKERSLS